MPTPLHFTHFALGALDSAAPDPDMKLPALAEELMENERENEGR